MRSYWRAIGFIHQVPGPHDLGVPNELVIEKDYLWGDILFFGYSSIEAFVHKWRGQHFLRS